MTWRRRTGIVTAEGGRTGRVAGFLGGAMVLAVVETDDAAADAVHVAVAVDDAGRVATVGDEADPAILAGPTLAELAHALAADVLGEADFGDVLHVAEDPNAPRSDDPFEQSFGAGIAYFADRAVVFTRAPAEDIVEIASQIEDVVHVREHAGGHLVFITEGPTLTSLSWPADALPVVIAEHGAAAPSITVIPAAAEAHIFTWQARTEQVPSLPEAPGERVRAFIDAYLGLGALVKELMVAFPAVEPAHVRASLEGEGASLPALLDALHLPGDLGGYLRSEVDATDLADTEEVHPATFAMNVRRVVSEASTTMSETAEAVRLRAVAVRTRAETAFDAAETFAEDVVLPARQNWVSPALAALETTLGVLALNRARTSHGAARAALSVGGVLLLSDAVVNTVITLAPLLRRRR